MKKLIFLCLFCALAFGARAAAYTEFFAQTTGSNLNSGSTTNDAANTTYAGGTWVVATLVFTVASGNPTTDPGVTNGAWASVYTTAGATVSTCVGLITNTTSTTITLDARTIAGSAANPSATAAATTCNVGGAWKGPNAAVGFPFGFIVGNATNGANYPRVNFRNGVTYNLTAAMTHTLVGPGRFQGMTSVPGDLGKAKFDGGASGTSYVLLTVSGAAWDLYDLLFDHNGNSGTADLVSSTSAGNINFVRCVFRDSWRNGLLLGASSSATSCESCTNNLGNGTPKGGFSVSGAGSILKNCISHDNSTANSVGFYFATSGVIENCVSYGNGLHGCLHDSTGGFRMYKCDFYNNGGSGLVDNLTTDSIFVINCNFLKNVGCAVSNSGPIRVGAIINCGFGVGSMVNGGANLFNGGAMEETGDLNYSSGTTPWVDPVNGNFSISPTSAARSAGYGLFTQFSLAAPTNTISFPDIGAGQSPDTNSWSYTFAQ